MNNLVNNWLDYSIIALVVLWSCYVVLRRFMPKTSFKWQQAFAFWLAQKGLLRLSNAIMPKAKQSGCSAGCSDCSVGNVDSSAAASSRATACATDTITREAPKEQPVQWR